MNLHPAPAAATATWAPSHPASLRQVQLALVLQESAVPFVIIGSTARRLDGSARTPQDLDVVVTRSRAAQMVDVLLPIATRSTPWRDGSASPWRAWTSWSPLDLFIDAELPAWHTIEIDGVGLRVADE